ncbi:putative transmembrane prolyl 4-hydroxylase [Apostichopus japonicus]|uniref:Putative transmembrane prolyl 4-hydroxylase n=1 Tax=Stichopus japonicus TaxID=307972 RepID=A0A2G8LH82_STIJA|nr:putative transmembrane prolyl 4-hydroxylase [Apostichopus japonicus]
MSPSISLLISISLLSFHLSFAEDELFESNNCNADDESHGSLLFQYNPVGKGVVHYVTDEAGREMEMVTLAMDPPIFEILNFLTDEECDHVVDLALQNGLEPSGVVMELLPSLSSGNEDEIQEIFSQLDVDEDTFLNPTECADGLMDIAEDIPFLTVDIDTVDLLIWTADMEKSVNEWVKKKIASNDTSFQFSNTRVSDQAWLDQTWEEDEILQRLHERVIKLTQLPRDIVISSESLQVVRYKPGGHYHAHFDSCELDDTLVCSHSQAISLEDDDVADENDEEEENEEEEEEEDDDEMEENVSDFDSRTSRLCRYATVLFYLSDVEDGGETAFPVADNGSFSYEGLEEMPYDVYDLSNHCYDGNLVVKPKKGKAIFWYNHMVNETTGWMGDVHDASLHGGCDVRKGEKWIANNWINIDDSLKKQVKYQEHFKRELEIGKEEEAKRRLADTQEEDNEDEHSQLESKFPETGESQEAEEGEEAEEGTKDEL